MAAVKSLSQLALEEFSSRISADSELPADLKQQLQRIISEEKWAKSAEVSGSLDSLGSEGVVE